MSKKAILQALDAEIRRLKKAIQLLSAPDYRAHIAGNSSRSAGRQRRHLSAEAKSKNICRSEKTMSSAHFFTVPTITFGILSCFFVIAHDRRRILHFHVTKHPNSLWVAQQLRESIPYEHRFKYLIFDRDAKFGNDVIRHMSRRPFPWVRLVLGLWCIVAVVNYLLLSGRHFPNPYFKQAAIGYTIIGILLFGSAIWTIAARNSSS